MQTFVVRVWLPDRPGALGEVASCIGAVGGDVVGIEILERGAGRAVDELLVALPEPERLEPLIAEVDRLDGVDVEDVRPLRVGRHDAGVAALELAAAIVAAADQDVVLGRFCDAVAVDFDCDWCSIVAVDPPAPRASVGQGPDVPWLAAFIEGSRHLANGDHAADEVGNGPDDLVWARLAGTGMAVAAGRRGRPFRWRERRQLALLARIAGRHLAAVAPLRPA